MHRKIHIKNATLVNEDRSFVGSLIIEDDTIAEILESGAEPAAPADEVVDATGCYLLPGVIDTHVHFRDPGLTDKADLDSESRAAAAGGVTTFFDMPNTLPQTVTPADVEKKLAAAYVHSHGCSSEPCQSPPRLWHQAIHGSLDRRHACRQASCLARGL